MSVKRKYILNPYIPHSDGTEKYERVFFKENVYFEGVCLLTRFPSGQNEYKKTYDDGRSVFVVAPHYYWLQFGSDGDNYFYTAEFDENGCLLQVYIDITGGNSFSSADKMYFDDMFIDIVYISDGSLYTLDSDELVSACESGEIKREEFDKAKMLADEELARLRKEGKNLEALCKNLFIKASSML